MQPSPKQRRRQVAHVVARNRIGSQAELLALLAAEGTTMTQATLSRDLREIGVRKRQGCYALAEGAVSPNQERRLLARLAASVARADATGPLVVVHTRPGLAQSVALELNAAGLPDVLGTIAGVDTVFVAVGSPSRARRLGSALAGRRVRD